MIKTGCINKKKNISKRNIIMNENEDVSQLDLRSSVQMASKLTAVN